MAARAGPGMETRRGSDDWGPYTCTTQESHEEIRAQENAASVGWMGFNSWAEDHGHRTVPAARPPS